MSLEVEDWIQVRTPMGFCQIQLLMGDITELSVEEKVDFVFTSAFVGKYGPSPGTLIASLKHNLNINVGNLAKKKEVDLRHQFSCWLSPPLDESLPFRRLVCFEQMANDDVDKQLSRLFRAMMPIFNNHDTTVITPLLATGSQHKPMDQVLRAMVTAAIDWMKAGLPLRCLKIVLFNKDPSDIRQQDQKCLQIFQNMKRKIVKIDKKADVKIVSYDISLSYSEKDQNLADAIVKAFLDQDSNLAIHAKVFEFQPDVLWQQDIYQVLSNSKRIVPLITPNYVGDDQCLEQFSISLCCNRLKKQECIMPLYLRTCQSLPSYLSLVQYINCRNQDSHDEASPQLSDAVDRIITSLSQASSSSQTPLSSNQSSPVKSWGKESMPDSTDKSTSHKNSSCLPDHTATPPTPSNADNSNDTSTLTTTLTTTTTTTTYKISVNGTIPTSTPTTNIPTNNISNDTNTNITTSTSNSRDTDSILAPSALHYNNGTTTTTPMTMTSDNSHEALPPPPNRRSTKKYDIFISYSHQHQTDPKHLVDCLQSFQPDMDIFFDVHGLKAGNLWQQTLYDAIENSYCLVAFLTDAYISSPVCNEEFNLATARHFAKASFLLLPIHTGNIEQVPRCFGHTPCVDLRKEEDGIKTLAGKLVNMIAQVKATNKTPTVQFIKNKMEHLRAAQFKEKFCVERGNIVRNTTTDFSVKGSLMLLFAQDCLKFAAIMSAILKQLAPNLVVHVQPVGHVDRMNLLEECDTVVGFVSDQLVCSQSLVEELHTVLGRHRQDNTVLYLIQYCHTSLHPTSFHILPYSICMDDSLWKRLERSTGGNRNPRPFVVDAPGMQGSYRCNASQNLALTAACHDLIHNLAQRGSVSTSSSPGNLVNIAQVENEVKGIENNLVPVNENIISLSSVDLILSRKSPKHVSHPTHPNGNPKPLAISPSTNTANDSHRNDKSISHTQNQTPVELVVQMPSKSENNDGDNEFKSDDSTTTTTTTTYRQNTEEVVLGRAGGKEENGRQLLSRSVETPSSPREKERSQHLSNPSLNLNVVVLGDGRGVGESIDEDFDDDDDDDVRNTISTKAKDQEATTSVCVATKGGNQKASKTCTIL